MPYSPFDLGNALSRAEGIKGQRLSNALAEQSLDPSSLRNQLLVERIRGLQNPTPNHGTYNPRDYTADSWAQFVESKDPSVLKRFATLRPAEIGGRKGLVNVITGEFIEQSSLADEGYARRYSENQQNVGRGLAEQGVDLSIASDGPVDIFKSEAERAADAEVAKVKAVDEYEASTPQAITTKQNKSAEAESVIENIDRLLTIRDDGRPVLSYAYGRENTMVADNLKPQEWVDAEAQRDLIVASLQLENVQKLKGTGPITENEQKILKQASSALSNPLISTKLAARELRRVREMFARWAGANRAAGITTEQPEDFSKLTDEELKAIIDGKQ